MAGVRPARAGQLTAVRLADDGTVTVELSGRGAPAVHAVSAASGTLARLYIDLPRGTRLAAAVPRVAGPAGAVDGLRIGAAEDGAPRIVVELANAAGYRVERGADHRTLTVAIAPAARVEPPEAPAPVRATASPPTAPARHGGFKIVLDPGHGGHDPGAAGFAVEKDVTLTIAQRLAQLLRERLGAHVVLTRTGDDTLTLAERTARANAEGADLFVSIHANASPGGRLHGVETYYLNNTADRATIRLAVLENGLDLLKPTRGRQADLRYILSDLVQVGKMDDSIGLARAVQRGLVGVLRARYPRVTNLGVKRGPFYVLVGAYMPCVLVETSFLTHPVEGRRMARVEYRGAVAEGIYSGIARYLADARRVQTL